MEQILYDCDPGQDDAMALLSALGNPDKVKILAVTTVGGNQKLNLVTQNAGHLLKFCHESLPLVSGSTAATTTGPWFYGYGWSRFVKLFLSSKRHECAVIYGSNFG